MRKWGLAEACASNTALFASSIFANEDTADALERLASGLRLAEQAAGGGPQRGLANVDGTSSVQPRLSCLTSDESSQRNKRVHDQLEGVNEGNSGKRAAAQHRMGRPAHCSPLGEGNDVMELSDDDFDLVVTKQPAGTNGLPGGIRRKGKASGKDPFPMFQGNAQELQELPSNHYELMIESRHADAEEPSPWDRALLPDSGSHRRLAEAGNATCKASKGKKNDNTGVMRESGGKKKESSVAPFFGGVAQVGAGGGEGKGDKMRKEREQNKCSNCHQTGHTKRTCPALADSARDVESRGNEKKRKSKSKLDAFDEDPGQSIHDKLAFLSVRMHTTLPIRSQPLPFSSI